MFSIGGVTALKQHLFFEFIDWNQLARLEIQPPFNFTSYAPMQSSSQTTVDQSTNSSSSSINKMMMMSHGDSSSDLQFFDEGFTQQSLSPSIIEDTLGNCSGTTSRNDPSGAMDPVDDEYEGFEYMTEAVEYTEDQMIEFQQLLQSRIVKGDDDYYHENVSSYEYMLL